MLAGHKCADCHSQKSNGNPAAIYRPFGRISTPGLLWGIVERCNSELNLGMFPNRSLL